MQADYEILKACYKQLQNFLPIYKTLPMGQDLYHSYITLTSIIWENMIFTEIVLSSEVCKRKNQMNKLSELMANYVCVGSVQVVQTLKNYSNRLKFNSWFEHFSVIWWKIIQYFPKMYSLIFYVIYLKFYIQVYFAEQYSNVFRTISY